MTVLNLRFLVYNIIYDTLWLVLLITVVSLYKVNINNFKMSAYISDNLSNQSLLSLGTIQWFVLMADRHNQFHNAMTMPLLAAVLVLSPACPQAYLGIWICVVMRICRLPLCTLIFFLKTNQMFLFSLGHQLQFFFWLKFQFCNVEWTQQSQDHLGHPHFALASKYEYIDYVRVVGIKWPVHHGCLHSTVH